MRGLTTGLAFAFGLLLVDAATHTFDFHIATKAVEVSPGVSRSKTVVNGRHTPSYQAVAERSL